jgi:hypothetical protein
VTAPRESLIAALAEALPYVGDDVCREKAGRVVEALQDFINWSAEPELYGVYQHLLEAAKKNAELIAKQSRFVTQPFDVLGPMKRWAESEYFPFEPPPEPDDEHVAYWKERAANYKPNGVNIGPAAWITIARESGYNPKVCAALRSIELGADSYLECLKKQDPDVRELLEALMEVIPPLADSDCMHFFGRLQAAYRKVRAKYE